MNLKLGILNLKTKKGWKLFAKKVLSSPSKDVKIEIEQYLDKEKMLVLELHRYMDLQGDYNSAWEVRVFTTTDIDIRKASEEKNIIYPIGETLLQRMFVTETFAREFLKELLDDKKRVEDIISLESIRGKL